MRTDGNYSTPKCDNYNRKSLVITETSCCFGNVLLALAMLLMMMTASCHGDQHNHPFSRMMVFRDLPDGVDRSSPQHLIVRTGYEVLFFFWNFTFVVFCTSLYWRFVSSRSKDKKPVICCLKVGVDRCQHWSKWWWTWIQSERQWPICEEKKHWGVADRQEAGGAAGTNM